ncbi:hypothetical protein H4R18_001313 [Coemansia javaensis]|uniref:F-box domain-containing protein n=1 Tax=Coemansia javaensis TaxID=2761396 RepID=A0A9W8HHG7_9FUNG|nr:hypothetical protein H4R18_001313 [Coemansia javaensis]
MHPRDLPDDVLRLVLRRSLRHPLQRSLEGYDDTRSKIKANLPLLAVCRRWRDLALPAVYAVVAIRHRAGPEDGHGVGPGGAETASNLGLVVAAGCMHAVRRVDISVHYADSPFAGLGAAMQLLREAADVWADVVELGVSLSGSARPFYVQDDSAVGREDDIKRAAAALAAAVPGVRCVLFGGPHVAALRDARIGCREEAEYQHPRVDPAGLVLLELIGWPSGHSWAPFGAADGGSKTIEFSSLRTLEVAYWCSMMTMYSADPQQQQLLLLQGGDGPPWSLRFPALDKLKLDCAQSVCPLLEHAVLPARMDAIDIQGTAAVLLRLAETPLPAARHINIGITSDCEGDPAALAAANRILEAARGGEEIELYVGDSSLAVTPEAITCTALTALLVDTATGADTMLALIPRLPNLVRLSFRRLKLSGIQEQDVSVPEPGDSRLAQPLDTRISRMLIAVSYHDQNWEMLLPLAKYLLLSIPTLTRFLPENLSDEAIEELVGAYSQQYPHLAAIRWF